MGTMRQALYNAMPRSQDWPAVDAVIRDLNDAGYVIVPIGPTAEMIIAGREADREFEAAAVADGVTMVSRWSRAKAIYGAMLAAAAAEQRAPGSPVGR